MASRTNEQFIQELTQHLDGMTVLELSELVKSLEEKYGVSASMVAAPAAAGATVAAVAEEKSEYKVILQSAGSNKIEAIKALRKAVSSLNLSEAKKAVEEAPTVIVEAASKEDAKKIKSELEAVGAKVELS